MLKTVGILTLSIAIVIFQVPQLAKAKMKKEIWVFSILLLLATLTAIGNLHDLPIPNPLDLIGMMMEPIRKLLSLILG